MKLTKADREVFVRSVLQDIPKTDYYSMLRDIVLEASKDALPAVVKDNWEELEPYLSSTYFWIADGSCFGYAQREAGGRTYAITAFPAAAKRIQEVEAKLKQQRSERLAVRQELEAAIASCSTLKQARERFPDLLKYLPADRVQAKTANVPAVRSEVVMQALTRAGWKKEA